MASIVKRGRTWSIRYVDLSRRHRILSTPCKSEREATTARLQLESILDARRRGMPIDAAARRWLGKNPDLHARLIDAGVIVDDGNSPNITLGEHLDRYFVRCSDVKHVTKIKWGQTRRNLLRFFGDEKLVREITIADAKDFERFLKTGARIARYGDKKKVDPLATDTRRKQIGHAKQFFRDAVERGIIEHNPFTGLKSSMVGNKKRQYFIDRPTTDRLLEACPDWKWRTIVALCRYGGLRCPSEPARLTWQDVDWSAGRIVVHSTKTEHHEGKDQRIVPLFPELRPFLEEAFELAAEGELHVVPGLSPDTNLRTQFLKIIARAGLQAWPKPFQNLRASRETELEDQFPSHVVRAWIGHGEQVANRHYLQVTDAHFELALDSGARAGARAFAQAGGRKGSQGDTKPSKLPHCAATPGSLVPPLGLEPRTY